MATKDPEMEVMIEDGEGGWLPRGRKMADKPRSEPTVKEKIKEINDEWQFLEGVHESEVLVKELIDVIRAAVAAETERCAKIADHIAELAEMGAGEYQWGERCKQIAASIRAEPDEEEN